jgi:hypothetical protein
MADSLPSWRGVLSQDIHQARNQKTRQDRRQHKTGEKHQGLTVTRGGADDACRALPRAPQYTMFFGLAKERVAPTISALRPVLAGALSGCGRCQASSRLRRPSQARYSAQTAVRGTRTASVLDQQGHAGQADHRPGRIAHQRPDLHQQCRGEPMQQAAAQGFCQHCARGQAKYKAEDQRGKKIVSITPPKSITHLRRTSAATGQFCGCGR